MYKILIVDDFVADRENIKDIIRAFKDIDIQIVGESENGLQALEMIESCRPDIILSDIEMPVCDGFELAKNIRISFPQIKIIFCSLYDEFEYAKRALYFDSYGYVLKPIDPQELRQCIIKVTGSLSDEFHQQEQIREFEYIKTLLVGYKPILVENFLKNLIQGLNSNSEEDIWEKIYYLGLNLRKGIYCLAYIEIDDFDKVTSGQTVEKQQIFSLKVYEKIKALLGSFDHTTLIRMDESHFVCIFSFVQETGTESVLKSAYACCNKILIEFKKSDVSLTLTVSSCCQSIFEIKSLYEQGNYLMKHKFSLGKGKVIYSDEVPSNKSYPDVDFNSILKETRFLLNSGTREVVYDYIDKLFTNLPENSGEQYLKNLCFCIVICVQIVLNENNDNFNEVFNSESLVWEKLLQFETIIDARNWIKNILVSINEYLANKSMNKNKLITADVKKYIEKNYVKNINLDVLAADLFYSPNYLNRVFKQETGETIFDYATHYRIEKAKNMLSDPKVKFYEVTEILGYSNPAYFSYVFKKFTGLSPKEYRERNVK